MAEYIEREELLRDIQEDVEDGGVGGMVAGALKRYVKRVPAADVAPVVRCKDCKHGYMFSEEEHLIGCPHYEDQVVDFEHFCAYGERRADNG